MYKFKAVAATTLPDLRQEAMTVEDLLAFEGHTDTIAVNYNSDTPAGEVTKAYVEDSKLIVEGVLKEKVEGYIAVSFMHFHGVNFPTAYGLIPNPSDTGTTPLEFIDED